MYRFGLVVCILFGVLLCVAFFAACGKKASVREETVVKEPGVTESGDEGSVTHPLIIDVRSPGEFAGKHIAGGINIPYSQIAQEIETYAENKSQRIILYCQSGARADVALKVLLEKGYTDVENFGGYAKAEGRLGLH